MREPGEDPGASVVMFGMHRGGSSITCRLLQVVLDGAGYRLVDEAKRYYDAGYLTDDIPRGFFTSLTPRGVFYGPFRTYPPTMRLADLSALTKILIVRDPRDCLVSSYFAQRGPHDRADLRRATARLPTSLDSEETIDDFCLRSATSARTVLDALRVLCLHYPDTLVFRYEDIYRDPCGWLSAIIVQLGLRVPDAALAQAQVEAVFDAAGEDESRHHRQGRPGDHWRKLSRQTAIHLSDFFAPHLTFFGFDGTRGQPAAWRPPEPAGMSASEDRSEIAALKRLVNDLQRENGFRIEELAVLRRAVAALAERAPARTAATLEQ